ncbi:MAG: glycosyltransferase family 4 protein [Euryarchaeota archaeon]|nr:glycosyltransferase family 4 protein [Euryarchaeota archaeon]
MRICYIGDAQSIHLQRWARSFAQRGHEVHVITDKPAKIEGVALHPVKENIGKPNILARAVNLYIRIRQSKKLIREMTPDILHAHFIFSYGYWGLKSGARPFIVSAWGSDIAWVKDDSIVGGITKDVIRGSDLVHTGDCAGKARLIELGCPPEKTFVQPWGVDTRRFSPSARSDDLRRKLLGREDGVIVTMVASLVPTWGIPALIESIPHIKAARNDMKIVIIGGGPEKERLDALATETGVEDMLMFTGKIPHDEVPKYLSSSDIYLDTVHIDKAGIGIGASVMEALSTGLPVLLASRHGIEEAVQNGVNGYIFDADKPRDLAVKMLGLAADAEARQRFGKASRELALRIGDWEKNMGEFERIYGKMAICRKP